MKRSKFVKLIAMGSAAATLSACDQPTPSSGLDETMAAFSSVDDCVSKAIYTERYCRDQYDAALKLHQAEAPRFNSKEECLAQLGEDSCQLQEINPAQTSVGATAQGSSGGSGSFWMPALTGFVIGQALGGRGAEYNYYNSSRPLYKTPKVYDYFRNPYYKKYKEDAYYGGGGGYAGGYSGGYSGSYSSGNRYPGAYSGASGLNDYKRAQQRTSVVSRSGFGARSSGFGSFGG